MTKYVALLRGINVGGRTIRMANLKTCFEGMGFGRVWTVLQSGNVLFEAALTDTDKLKKQIETGLIARYGYQAKVQVYQIDRLARIIEVCPFEDDDADFHAYVLFFEDGHGRELANEPIELEPGEQLQAGGRVVYWRCRKGRTLQSQVAKQLTRARYRDFHTSRNLRTLKKLVQSSAAAAVDRFREKYGGWDGTAEVLRSRGRH